MRSLYLSSCICGGAAVPVQNQGTNGDGVIETVTQKEQRGWPNAAKGYPPSPPSASGSTQKTQGVQEGGSSSLTSDDSSTPVESPTAPHTADSSPLPTSTVALLEQLANTPEVLQGRSKEARKENVGKPPRPPPIEDTLQTAWTGRERIDRWGSMLCAPSPLRMLFVAGNCQGTKCFLYQCETGRKLGSNYRITEVSIP